MDLMKTQRITLSPFEENSQNSYFNLINFCSVSYILDDIPIWSHQFFLEFSSPRTLDILETWKQFSFLNQT